MFDRRVTTGLDVRPIEDHIMYLDVKVVNSLSPFLSRFILQTCLHKIDDYGAVNSIYNK